MDQKEINRLRSQVQLASQYIKSGRREEAGDIYDEISARASSDPRLNADLGNLCTHFGANDKAIQHFEISIQQEPYNPEYLALLGIALLKTSDSPMARESFSKALALNKDETAALYGMGIILFGEGKYQESIDFLQRVLKHRSKDTNVLRNLSEAWKNLGDYEKAQEFLDKAIKLNPKDEQALTDLGTLLAETGQNDTAQKHYEQMIRNKIGVGTAYANIARLKNFSSKDQVYIGKVAKTLDQGMPPQQRYLIHYALAKMHDDCQQYDDAFDQFRKANLLQKEPYDSKHDLNWQKLVAKAFTRKSIDKLASIGHESDLPVFIIGMPRSGTTLLERIIASHELADGAGELLEMPNILHQIIDEKNPETASAIENRLQKDEMRSYAEHYLSVLSKNREGAKRVVDKLPGNYMSVGLIASLFPNSTIININRNPLDTCLSCYFQAFEAVRWSNDLKDIVATYRIYRDYLEYWKSILPAGQILEIQYKTLVENSAEESKKVLEFCGLDWNPDILDFHEKESTIRTASRWQVRQPIYKSSSMRWKNYAPFINDLAQDLANFLESDREPLSEFGIELKKPKRFGLF